MPWKAKTVIDGKETEVELQTLPDGVIPREQFDVQFATELNRRTEGLKKSLRTDLLADEEFRKEAATAWKFGPLDDEKKQKQKELSEDQLQGLRSAWEKEHLAPLKQQVEQYGKTVTSMRQHALVGDILTAAAKVGVKKSLLEPAMEGSDPLIVAMLRPLFGFEEKSGMWALKKGDGFEFSAKATEHQPYKGVAEVVSEWSKKKEAGDFLERQTQSGAGFGGAAEAGGGGEVQISRADARIRSKFIDAEKRAKEANATLVITD